MKRIVFYKEVIRTSFPLMGSVLSYPLYSIVLLSIISFSYPSELNNYILAASIAVVYIRFCEGVLSGTRVIASYHIDEPLVRHHKILSSSIFLGFWLGTIGLVLGAFIYILVPVGFYYKETFLSLAVMALGFWGNFLFNSAVYYVHAHKKTNKVPFISWYANILGLVSAYLGANVLKLEYIDVLLIATLSRNILGGLAFLSIPRSLREKIYLNYITIFSRLWSIFKVGFSTGAQGLLFTGTYLVLTFLIERSAPVQLATFQSQMNLLNIFSTINVTIASSGAIILSHSRKKNIQDRALILSSNIFLNAAIALILCSLTYIFASEITYIMGNKEIIYQLFKDTFFLVSCIYFLDLFQIIITQTMVYHRDYLLPPIIRTGIFSIFTLSSCFIYNLLFSLNNNSVLTMIVGGTLVSSVFVCFRFFSSHSELGREAYKQLTMKRPQ